MCPICITRMKCNWLVTGIKPIITHSFGTQGQVNLIDFQSMPNGNFCFLMNYIDHGVKFLFSIPLTHKHASCIAIAPLEVFTVVRPPMILQSDNWNEFNKAATTRKQVNEFCGKLVRLTDLELSEIIWGEAIVAQVLDGPQIPTSLSIQWWGWTSKPHHAEKAWCLDEGLQVETVDNWLSLDDVAIQYTEIIAPLAIFFIILFLVSCLALAFLRFLLMPLFSPNLQWRFNWIACATITERLMSRIMRQQWLRLLMMWKRVRSQLWQDSGQHQ